MLTAVAPASATWITLTPFTQLAAARALALAAAGTPLEVAVAACNAQLAQQLGLSDLVGTHAIAATDATRLATASLQERVQALVVAGLAEEAAGLGVRAIDLAAALALDVADGVLDGLAGSTSISVPLIAGGSVSLPATAASTDLQAAIDAFAASAANKTHLATAVVSPAPAPVGPTGTFYVTSTALPAWTSGQAGSAALAATGGTPPYTCALTSGTLPSWLALAGCTLSGTAPVLAGGTTRSVSAPFTLTITDSAGAHASQAVTLSVTVLQPKPVLTPVSPLAQGVVSIPYSQSAAASVSQGSPPYHYTLDSLANGAPPPGLVLDLAGRVAGTPTHAGTYAFGICVVDLVGSSSCASTSLTVINLPAGGLTTSYAGSFSGAGDFSRLFPGYTTCTFHNVFSGTVNVTISAQSGGAYTGTAHVVGTWDSTATGGSTASFDCLDSSLPWENDLALSGTLPVIEWSDEWSTPGGSNVTGTFTGTASQAALVGTQVETMDTSTGSASLSMSLPRQ